VKTRRENLKSYIYETFRIRSLLLQLPVQKVSFIQSL
jgi:hypothetical protein